MHLETVEHFVAIFYVLKQQPRDVKLLAETRHFCISLKESTGFCLANRSS